MVKAGADGRTVRLRDVARVELGALAYTTNSFLLRKSAVAMLVTQRPGSNALATAKNISDTMEQAEGQLSARASTTTSATTRPNSSRNPSAN